MQKKQKAYKRKHNIRLIKQAHGYSFKEIIGLFKISRMTLTSWIKKGLKVLIDGHPKLIHGSDLYEFLAKQQSARETQLRADQFYCFKCKKATFAKQGTLERIIDKRGRPQNKALCTICKSTICRITPRKTSDTQHN